MTPQQKPEKRTIQDIEWHELEINGKKEQVLNRQDAALYVGRTPARFDTILKDDYPEVQKYQIGPGRQRFFLKRDLDRIKKDLNTVRPAE